jgi:hypothetical protein
MTDKETMRFALGEMKIGNYNSAAERLEAALAKQEQRCEYCDGTGDVHDQTGEWRGVCVCEAGAKQYQGELVALPCVVVDVDYSLDTAAVLIQDTRDYEFNNCQYWLTTEKPQPAQKPLTGEQKLEIAESAVLKFDWSNDYLQAIAFVVEQCEAAHSIKHDK